MRYVMCLLKRFSRTLSTSAVCQGTTKMSRLNVRKTDDERLQISLVYAHNGGSLKEYNLNRLQSEPFENTAERLKKSIRTKTSKKCKKRKLEGAASEEEDIAISLYLDGMSVEGDAKNADVFVKGAVLQIQDCKLNVNINVPKVLTFSLPSNIMAGFPIFPSFDVEFTDVDQCKFTWKKFKLKPTCLENRNSLNLGDYSECIEVSKDQVYTPSVDDVGFYLRLECVPCAKDVEGDVETTVTKSLISPGPGLCPFENRHAYTELRSEGNSLRMVSYNILADMFADTDFTKNELYPYCASFALEFDYRRQLLLKELIGYNSDIMCLQEVDKKHFLATFIPCLERVGYTGLLQTKGENHGEGAAIFYRKSRFRFISDHSIVMKDAVSTDEIYTDLRSKINSCPPICDRFFRLGTTLQLVILECLDRPGQKICVANTHLFFYPLADNIRLLQSIVCMRHIESVLQPFIDRGENIPLVFCGDFNSRPARGVHRFITTGMVPADISDWREQSDEEHMPEMSFKHSLSLKSACGYPEYTNYVGNFHEHLDYVFIDTKNFEVERVIEPPTHEEVIAHTALPSVLFPSDHIAQVCDIRWINKQES